MNEHQRTSEQVPTGTVQVVTLVPCERQQHTARQTVYAPPQTEPTDLFEISTKTHLRALSWATQRTQRGHTFLVVREQRESCCDKRSSLWSLSSLAQLSRGGQ